MKFYNTVTERDEILPYGCRKRLNILLRFLQKATKLYLRTAERLNLSFELQKATKSFIRVAERD